MKGPLFSQDDLNRIRELNLTDSDVVHADFADAILRVTRDRTDIGLPAGTLIVARYKQAANPGDLVVIVEGDEHVLRKAPVENGKIAGVVLGVLVREAE